MQSFTVLSVLPYHGRTALKVTLSSVIRHLRPLLSVSSVVVFFIAPRVPEGPPGTSSFVRRIGRRRADRYDVFLELLRRQFICLDTVVYSRDKTSRRVRKRCASFPVFHGRVSAAAAVAAAGLVYFFFREKNSRLWDTCVPAEIRDGEFSPTVCRRGGNTAARIGDAFPNTRKYMPILLLHLSDMG